MTDHYGKIPISSSKLQKKKVRQTKKTQKQEPSKKSSVTPVKKSSKRVWYVALALFILFSGYYILSAIFFPILIQQRLPQKFNEDTGLSLTIESGKFNPLQFSFSFDNVSIDSPGESGKITKLLNIKELFVDLHFVSLLRSGLVSEKIYLKGADLSLIRFSDQSYNVSQFISQESFQTSGSLQFADLPFLYSFNNISVNDSTIFFSDKLTGKEHRIEELQLQVPTIANFSHDAGSYIQPQFSAVINGSPVALTGERSATLGNGSTDRTTKLTCTLQSFDIPTFSDYLPFSLPLDITRGKADGKLDFSFVHQKKGSLQLVVDFQLNGKNLALVDERNTLTLETPSALLHGSVKPFHNDFSLEKFIVKKPLITVRDVNADGLYETFFKVKPDDTGGRRSTSGDTQFTIDQLILDEGKVVVIDKARETTYFPVQLSIKHYANKQALNSRNLQEKGTFRLNGESEENMSLFSWHGKFKDALPAGECEIGNVPLPLLFSALPQNNTISGKGSAFLQGKLSLHESSDSSIKLFFENGTAHLSGMQLSENERLWFTGKKGKVAPISFIDDKLILGNLSFESARVDLHKDQFSRLLKALLNGSDIKFDTIDIQGELKISESANDKNPLLLNTAHFQLSSISPQLPKKDNFSLMGKNESGFLEVAGKLARSPMKGSLTVKMKNIHATRLIPDTTAKLFSDNSRTRFTGEGTLHLGDKNFKGRIIINDGDVSLQDQKGKFSFKTAEFVDLLIPESGQQLKFSKASFTGPSFENTNLRLLGTSASIGALTQGNNTLHLSDVQLSGMKVFLKQSLKNVVSPLFDDSPGKFKLTELKFDGDLFFTTPEGNDKELLKNVKLHLSSVQNTPPDSKNFFLQAESVNKGEILAEGNLALFPVQSQFDLQFSAIETKQFKGCIPLLNDIGLETILDGTVKGYYPEKKWIGTVSLDGGRISPSFNDFSMKWEKMNVSNFAIHLNPPKISIEEAYLYKPVSTLQLDGRNYLSAVKDEINSLLYHTVEKNRKQQTTLEIASTMIEHGSLQYYDNRLTPVWSLHLTDIKGKINGLSLSTKSSPIDYSFDGKIGDTPFTYEGRFSDNTASPLNLFSIHVQDFPLKQLDSALLHDVKLNIDSASIDLLFQKSEREADAKISFSTRSLLSMPDDVNGELALALLEDKDGVITETFTVKQQDRHFAQLMKNHLNKLIVKANVSPYLLLKPPHNRIANQQTIAFEPGQSSLQSNTAILDNYGELMNAHPRLTFQLSATVDTTADRLALEKVKNDEEQKRVDSINTRRLQEWQNKQLSKVQNPPPPSDAPSVITEENLDVFVPEKPRKILVADEMLKTLGIERMENIILYLMENHAISRDRLISKPDISVINSIDPPNVRLSFYPVTR